jgi:hypothetical protein
VGTINDVEAELTSRLQRLRQEDRVAFAAACAERLMHVGRSGAPTSISGSWSALCAVLEHLWNELGGPLPIDIQRRIDLCDSALLPDDEGEWSVERAMTEDAVNALAYALRCWKTGHQQDAVWAARRGYEALHYFIEQSEPDSLTWSAQNQSLFDHPLVAAERARQRRDLEELLNEKIAKSQLCARARTEASSFIPGRHE